MRQKRSKKIISTNPDDEIEKHQDYESNDGIENKLKFNKMDKNDN